MSPFLSNRRGRPVTGINNSLFIQDQEFLLNRSHDLLIGPPPKVGSADTALEKSVAREKDVDLSGKMETQTSRGMTWGKENLSGVFPETNCISLVNKVVNLDH